MWQSHVREKGEKGEYISAVGIQSHQWLLQLNEVKKSLEPGPRPLEERSASLSCCFLDLFRETFFFIINASFEPAESLFALLTYILKW